MTKLPESSECSEHEPKYRGVRKRKWGKWVCEIRMPNSRERIWLGSYNSPEKAARAFDAASCCLRGKAAKLNFPDQPPNIPGGTSLSNSEIQSEATRFANSVPDAVAVIETDNPGSESASSNSVILHDDNTNNVDDYDIFPGFDDYFMQPPPRYPDYEEENSNGEDISQGPSILWNY